MGSAARVFGQASGLQIVVDASGNSYVSGMFRGTIPLGSSTLTNQGGMDEYIVKYTAQSTPEWGLRTTDNFTQSTYGYALVPPKVMRLALDAQGNLYTATQFRGTVTRGTSTFTSQGAACTADALLTKYTSQGQVLWAQQGGGSNSDAAVDVAVDNAGNAYVLGEFGGLGPATFGSVTFQPDVSLQNNQNLYVLKYDAQGNTQWGVPVLPLSLRD